MGRQKLLALRAVCLIVCLHFGAWVLLGLFAGSPDPTESSILRDELIDTIIVLLILFFCKKAYQIPFEEMAINYPPGGIRVWLGILTGGVLWIAAGSISETVEKLFPVFTSIPSEHDFLAIYSQAQGAFRVVFFIVLGFVTPVIEEVFFRGLIHAVLRREFAPAVTLLLSSVIFGLWHVYPSLIVFSFLVGCGLTWLRDYEKSLVGPIVAHATVNCLSLIFYGTR